MKKQLLFSALFVGWLAYYLCYRTLPSSLPYMLSLGPTDQPSNSSSSSSSPGPTPADLDTATHTHVTPFSRSYLGQLQSLFALSSSFSFLVSGVLSDVVNVRLLFSASLGLSGLLLAAFPLTEGSRLSGSLLYVCLGLTLGVGWPCTAKILRQTYRPSDLGVAWGVMSTSSSVATFLAPLLVSSIVSSGSWEYSFYTFGLTAMTLALPVSLVTLFLTSSPSADSHVGMDERKVSRLHVVFIGPLWGVMIMHAMMWVVKATVQDWGLLYLMQRQSLQEVSAGKAMGFVQLGGVVGKLIMGYVSNLAMRSQGIGRFVTSGRTCKSIVLVLDLLLLFMVVLVFATLPAGPISQASYSTLLMLFGIGLLAEGAIVNITLTSMDVVPKNLAGTGQATSAASAQMIGKFLAGWPFTGLIEWIGWSSSFLAVSGSCVVALTVSSCLATSFHRLHLKQKKEK